MPCVLCGLTCLGMFSLCICRLPTSNQDVGKPVGSFVRGQEVAGKARLQSAGASVAACQVGVPAEACILEFPATFAAPGPTLSRLVFSGFLLASKPWTLKTSSAICHLLLVNSAQNAHISVTHSRLCKPLQVVRYMDSVGIFMDIGASRER